MKHFFINKIINGDCLKLLKTLPDGCVNCCITSPPYYGLRDYGVAGQIGLEESPEAYIQKLVEVFGEVWRVLKKDGTLWLNLGDSYYGSNKGIGADGSAYGGKKQMTNCVSIGLPVIKNVQGLKPKDLIGIPWRVAFALQAEGYYLRQDIIWHKPNPMPESVTDRCTKAHEYVFLMAKSQKYYFDNEAIKEKSVEPIRAREKNNGESSVDTKRRGYDCNCGNNGYRNKRSVWTVTTKPFKGAHFATFPEALVEPMIKAGCPVGGVVLDPFMGSGTVGKVARKLLRNYIGIELNPKYCDDIAKKRTTNIQPYLEIMT